MTLPELSVVPESIWLHYVKVFDTRDSCLLYEPHRLGVCNGVVGDPDFQRAL